MMKTKEVKTKDRVVPFRVNEEEYKKLEQEAEKLEKSKSEKPNIGRYIRLKLFGVKK